MPKDLFAKPSAKDEKGKKSTSSKSSDEESIKTWMKRIDAGKALKKEWEERDRVETCYNYWRGEQLEKPLDDNGFRKAQVNKIHPEVRNQIPALYFYHPFARISAQPELADTPGSDIDEQMQLLQDTCNHLIRTPSVKFKEVTLIALKEAHWALGAVEVGHSAEFMDDPRATRPALKEDEDTKISSPVKDEDGLGVGEDSDAESMEREVKRLEGRVKEERFFLKHIPAKQIILSPSDKPILEENDWVGYWEDVPLEDVKRAKGYRNVEDLEAAGVEDDEEQRRREMDEGMGTPDRIRLYKLWDIRTKTRLVLAHGHKKYLLRKKYKRLPLKFLRFDIDPYHFFPRPPILAKLGPQDEYNAGREYIRKEQLARVTRFTYDEDGVEAEQIKKFERNEMGILIPRKAGTHQVIEPVEQPSYSGEAIQSLTLSDKEFKDSGGVGGDAQVAQTKTATQAKIAEVKNQAQDSADRVVMADFLGAIAEELLLLAIDNLLLTQWVAINVAPDSMYAPMEAEQVQKRYRAVTAQKLLDASQGVEWSLQVDMESLSPVAEEEKFQKWMQGLSFVGNPGMAQVFAMAPELLRYTLRLMGLRSGREQEMIVGALQKLAQGQQQAMAAAQAGGGSPPGPGPGISPLPGGEAPGGPPPSSPIPNGGPQPGAPPGPGASQPT